ncbi:hypothetical protein CsSME_00054197 [Camellia sinensis var. sinensis]
MQHGLTGRTTITQLLVLMEDSLMEFMFRLSISLQNKVSSPDIFIHSFGASSKSVHWLEIKYQVILFGRSFSLQPLLAWGCCFLLFLLETCRTFSRLLDAGG